MSREGRGREGGREGGRGKMATSGMQHLYCFNLAPVWGRGGGSITS